MTPAAFTRPAWPGSPVTRLDALVVAAALAIGAYLGLSAGIAVTVRAVREVAGLARSRDQNRRA